MRVSSWLGFAERWEGCRLFWPSRRSWLLMRTPRSLSGWLSDGQIRIGKHMATTVTPPTPSVAENAPSDAVAFDDLIGLGSEPDEGEAVTAPPPAPAEPPPSVPAAAEPPASATTTPTGVQEVQPPQSQAPTPPMAQPQVQQPAPSQPPAATPQVVTPPAPPQPVAPQPTVQAPPPQPAQQPPRLTQEEVIQRRQALIDDIAGRYAISEEDKAALAVEPEKVLPKIAGRLYVDVYEAVLQASLSQLPQLINGYTQVQRVAQQHEQAFYSKWPALQKPEYEPTIRQIAATYRQMNPQASADDMMNAVGVISMVQLGLGTAPASAAPPAAAPPPAQVPVQQPPVVAQRPFTPAGVGGANSTPAAATPGPFDDLLAPDRYED